MKVRSCEVRSCAFLMILMVLFVGLAATTVAGKEIKKDFHETFTVQEGDRLHLVHGDGDVSIEPWERDEIDITVVYHTEFSKVGLGSDPDFEVEFRQSGGTVTVIGKEAHTVVVGFTSRRHYEYSYTIRAPEYLRLDLEGDDGDVQIVKWRGEVTCSLDDGDVELTDIRTARTEIDMQDGDLRIREFAGQLEVDIDDGDLHLVRFENTRCRVKMQDGDALIEDIAGDLEIRADDGDIDVLRARLGKADVRTEDGNIDLDILAAKDLDLYAATSDGDITINLAKDVSATFSIDVDDGRIKLDLPDAHIEREEEDMATGRIGGGAGRIRVKSDDGRVTLREAR